MQKNKYRKYKILIPKNFYQETVERGKGMKNLRKETAIKLYKERKMNLI